MWKNLWQNKTWLSILSGLCLVLAFPPIEIFPLTFLFPVFLLRLLDLCEKPKRAFFYGFLVSLVIMLGGFYWVTYVIHEFGYLPWWISFLLYLVFCGFGALNFPLFMAIGCWIRGKFSFDQDLPSARLWNLLMLPMLFTGIEYLIPKLFPWYVGHGLYQALWLIQVVDITGSSFLTFGVMTLGAAVYWGLRNGEKREWRWITLPFGLWVLCLFYSLYQLNAPPLQGREFRVGFVQANIGSLEKARARKSILEAVRNTMNQYKELTDKLLVEGPKPDLILWPETAMPFQMDGIGIWPRDIRQFVLDRKLTLITGAYSKGKYNQRLDNNAAYLLETDSHSELRLDIYRKNILLAFGEYFPGGEWLPDLYRWFPQVSHFELGREQNAFTLEDGTRLGVTICYEALVPSYFAKVASSGVHAIVNLTNDSWFGPTSEPHQHGALTVFRAIETRIPFFRVTNTGVSFAVDHLGHISPKTPVYDKGILNWVWRLPKDPPFTPYQRWGEWFLGLCSILFGILLFRRFRNASVSH